MPRSPESDTPSKQLTLSRQVVEHSHTGLEIPVRDMIEVVVLLVHPEHRRDGRCEAQTE